jgi:alkyl sulfatase BDS1-like metallo-beta-lactamase superfamily hydrolase
MAGREITNGLPRKRDSGQSLELADRLWEGEERIEDHHPVGFSGGLEQVAPGVAFVPSLANVTAFATEDGLVLVDTGGFMLASRVYDQLRSWSTLPLHTAIYTHGHVDHVFGMPLFEQEAAEADWPPPRVVAHENVAARFDRYAATAGYNSAINARQFQLPELTFPTDFRYPDETYRDGCALEIGEERFELRHAKGETDDHTWIWAPRRRILCCGDLFIWATPNAGNPQKVQRYPQEWAAALREMAGLDADLMLPGHGLPVAGAERVRAALEDTAALLESLCEQTLALMNEGASLDEIVHSVRAPAELLQRPYLSPVYDEPEFIVRNLWRLYGGWYEGDPARLKPARAGDLAAEIAALAGGTENLARRALELAAAGELRLSGHLAELAGAADPSSAAAHRARAEVNERRAAQERSTMARGIFASAAAESRRALEEAG